MLFGEFNASYVVGRGRKLEFGNRAPPPSSFSNESNSRIPEFLFFFFRIKTRPFAWIYFESFPSFFPFLHLLPKREIFRVRGTSPPDTIVLQWKNLSLPIYPQLQKIIRKFSSCLSHPFLSISFPLCYDVGFVRIWRQWMEIFWETDVGKRKTGLLRRPSLNPEERQENTWGLSYNFFAFFSFFLDVGNRSRLHPLGGQGGKRKKSPMNFYGQISCLVVVGKGKPKLVRSWFRQILRQIWERKGRGGAKGKYRGNRRRRRFLSPALFGFFRDRLRDFFFKNLFSKK